jgi:hypothetical protein
MPDHPFTHAYIGLGLLDESSILRDGDAWAAEYRDAVGEPYVVVYAGPTLVKIVEFGGDKRVAVTLAPNFTRAIGMHGADALGGERSRFWVRVAASTPLAWVQIACPSARFSFVAGQGARGLRSPRATCVWQRAEAGGVGTSRQEP